MTRKLLNLLLFALCVSFAACSDGDDYNANTAESHYKPVEGRRMVAQVKTVNTVDGRNYSWEHNFTYDVHGRIKEINSMQPTVMDWSWIGHEGEGEDF